VEQIVISVISTIAITAAIAILGALAVGY